MKRDFNLATPHGLLAGELTLPAAPRGLVLLPAVQPTPLDRLVAAHLAEDGYALLFLPLLTSADAAFPDAAHNVPLLARRLTEALDLMRRDGDTESLPLGLFAPAHATPAAIRAAARRDLQVRALACHGGLPDLAGVQHLELLAAPLLMLADSEDTAATASFRRSTPHLSAAHELHRLAPGENPAGPIARWFGQYLQAV